MGGFLVNHVEDFALGVGSLLISAGIGAAFGWPFGLIAAGALLVAYGVWIVMLPLALRSE